MGPTLQAIQHGMRIWTAPSKYALVVKFSVSMCTRLYVRLNCYFTYPDSFRQKTDFETLDIQKESNLESDL